MTDKKKTDVETCDSSTSMDERDTDWLSSGHKNPLYRCLLSGWSTKEFFAEFLGTFILMVSPCNPFPLITHSLTTTTNR